MGMTVLRKGGSTPVASDDRILFDKIFDAAGIITGGGATMSAVNKIHVPETTAWIKGTEIKIDEQDVTVGLSDSGTKYGRVLLVVDWSTEETAHFEYEVAASTSAFQELTQEDDINFSGGTWEEVFATYTCTEASISNVAFCMSMLQDANGGALIAGSESGTLSTQPYVAGQYLIWNGKLKKATAAIAIGDTLAVGTNLSADTTVGSELYALNSSLSDIDIRYTTANGAEWSPRGAGTWSPFNSNPLHWIAGYKNGGSGSMTLPNGKYLLVESTYDSGIAAVTVTGDAQLVSSTNLGTVSVQGSARYTLIAWEIEVNGSGGSGTFSVSFSTNTYGGFGLWKIDSNLQSATLLNTPLSKGKYCMVMATYDNTCGAWGTNFTTSSGSLEVMGYMGYHPLYGEGRYAISAICVDIKEDDTVISRINYNPSANGCNIFMKFE